jgi:hypothetical protein
MKPHGYIPSYSMFPELFSFSAHTSIQRKQHTFIDILATLTQLWEVIESLEKQSVTALSFVLSLLPDNRLQDQPCTQDLIDQADEILQAFYEHPKSSKSTLTWANVRIPYSHMPI